MVSKAAGLQPAGAGDLLRAGSRIVVGPGGSASIRVGKVCHMTLAQNSDVSMPQISGRICVQVHQATAGGSPTELSAAPEPIQAQAAEDGFDEKLLIPLGGLLLLGAGAGLLIALDDGSSSTSP